MKCRKILSMIMAISFLLTMISVPQAATVYGASTSLQVSNSQVIKGQNGSVVVTLKDNDKTVAGIEFFIQLDTDVLSVSDVVSKLPSEWELDWKAKENSKYGKGIHCMIQDKEVNGITSTEKGIVEIKLDDKNVETGKEYAVDINVIDVCDSNGNSIKSSVTGVDGSVKYVNEDEQLIKISKDVQVEGFQVSQTSGGVRTVSSVEPQINQQKVVEFGNVYAIVKEGITAQDVYVGSTSAYVKDYMATEKGILTENKFSDSYSATEYVRTMVENGTTREALTQEYIMRAYAKLADGTYVYSEACKYSVFNVAKQIYDRAMAQEAELVKQQLIAEAQSRLASAARAMGADGLIGGLMSLFSMMLVVGIITLFTEFFSDIFGDNEE